MKEKIFRKLYPVSQSGEPNLNPLWAVWYRKINQWVRRAYWHLRPKRRQELLLSMRKFHEVGVPPELFWKLGKGSIFRFTDAQRERQRELTRRILAKSSGK